MRRSWPALVVLLLALCGCTATAEPDAPPGEEEVLTDGAGSTGPAGTLTVFAAASLTEVFTTLGDQLVQQHPSLEIRFNFAGSSALATQLLQGAPADVFAAADEMQMARVEEAGLTGEPRIFTRNALTLAVPPDDPAGITTRPTGDDPGLADLLAGDPTLAVCAPEVPCGAAAATVLRAGGIAGVVDTYEDDARAVLTKVQLGEVDAGLVYFSDLSAAGETVLGLGFREAQADAAVNRYPIAVLRDAPAAEAAQAFQELVLSTTGQQLLRSAGFLDL